MSISRISASGAGLYGHAGLRIRKSQSVSGYAQSPSHGFSKNTLRQVLRLQEALKSLRSHRNVSTRGTTGVTPAEYGSAVSRTLFNDGPISLRSTAEVNTAPTSFTKFGPDMLGSQLSAPWEGDSTATAIVGGSYDGSHGSGELTFRAIRGGEVGEDDIRVRVYAADGAELETIKIEKEHEPGHVYQLSNGLELSLGPGQVEDLDEFKVDVSLLTTSYTPGDDWITSSANATIGGQYDGSDGTGELTFQVTRGGVHGEDDLQFKIYRPDGSQIEKLDIKDDDPLGTEYTLSNGLTLSLSGGDLIKGETFKVSVDAADSSATGPTSPPWIAGSAKPTFSGTYDGTLGDGALQVKASTSGIHGDKDLDLKVYRPDGSFLKKIEVKADDPIDQVYDLGGGLQLTLGAGDLIKNEIFTVDLGRPQPSSPRDLTK